jgi:hypothetical protein
VYSTGTEISKYQTHFYLWGTNSLFFDDDLLVLPLLLLLLPLNLGQVR